MSELIGYGGKSGSGSGGSESPDNLLSVSYASIMDLISEGEIQGLVNGLQSVYFNQTPLQNANGTYNFTGATVTFNPGTQSQAPLPGFPAVNDEVSVGTVLYSYAPWVQNLNNLQLNAVRVTLSVPSLSQTNTSNGNVSGYQIDYMIQVSTDGGAYVTMVNTSFNGKCTSEYDRTHTISLPTAHTGWNVMVTRLTANANSAYIADTVNIVSYTEVIYANLRYPMSAVAGIQIDAQQFGTSIPTRAYDVEGRIISVPSNYNPTTRIYSGVWNGTFMPAYTNNPAWVFYDLVLNNRYGLGTRVSASQIDKWALYQIGQYCDELVPDGLGGSGMEPRFTCNLYLQQVGDAYKVLQDLASIFQGMAYWAAGNIVAVADMPTDPTYTYTAANVIGGKFTCVGSPMKTRYNVAAVTWNDPSNFYRQSVETVQDQVGISRYGIQQTSITAFGCTSQGQAQRVGLWTILTSRLETQTVTFSVGLDGIMCAPGEIIRVADPVKMGRRNGGRIHGVSGNTITVDKIPPTIAVGNPFTVILPTGVSETQLVQSFSGNSITVASPFSTQPVRQAVWTIDNSDLVAPTYKVLSITETDNFTFEITALEHNASKYAAIDDGAIVVIPPQSVIPPSVQPPVASVTASTYNTVNQGIQNTTLVISWQAAEYANSYIAEWQWDNNNWITLPSTGLLQAEVNGIYAGNYQCRVTAVNPLGYKSIPTYSSLTALTGYVGAPPVVTTLTTAPQVFGIQINWNFPAIGATDTSCTQLWYGVTDVLANATLLGSYPYPQSSFTMLGLESGATLYFWARLVDNSGNIGAFYPTGPTGVSGTSSTDSTAILTYLTNQITLTQLGQDVLAPIESIPSLLTNLDGTADALAATQMSSSIAADSAVAQATTNLQASVAGNNAAILSESTARAQADSALAQNINTVSATVGNVSTVASQAATAVNNTNGQLAAMYTIKTAVTAGGVTYAAGIGVGVDNASGILESQVLVAADKFAIINESTSGITTPFAVVGGQTYINNAIIGNASITSAQIANATITAANIANETVGTSQIANGAITSAQIASATIVNANIQNAAVGTLTVAGNAITSTAAAAGGSGTVSVGTNIYGGLVQVIAYGQGSTGPNASTVIFHLYRDGISLGIVNAAPNGSACILYVDNPGAGGHTYTFTSANNGGGGGSTYISALETKR